MTSDLLMGFPDVTLSGTGTTSQTAATGYEITNLTTGSRGSSFKLATAYNGTLQLTWNQGAGLSKAAQFLIISRANLLQKDSVTAVALKGYNATSWDVIPVNDASFASATLYGPRAEDYLATFNTTSRNYLLNPNDISVATYWAPTRCSASAVDTLKEDSSNSTHYVFTYTTGPLISPTIPVGATVLFEMDVAANGRNYVMLQAQSSTDQTYYDIANVVTGTVGGGVAASITNIDGTWRHITLAKTVTGSPLDSVAIFIVNGSTAAGKSYLGDGAKGIKVKNISLTNTSIVATTPFRYWRQELTSSAASYFNMSKAYIGSWFDMGRDPSLDEGARNSRQSMISGARDLAHKFELKWKGVTDAKRSEFMSKIGRYADINPIYLYDSTDVLLRGAKLLHATASNIDVRPDAVNSNTISATFEECI